jgi:hypothetical protein
MKSLATIILLLCVSLALVGMVSTIIIKGAPTAQSVAGNVIIRWDTSDETGVLRFEVLRVGTVGDFALVGIVDQLKGNNSSYEFVDKSAFKSTDSFYLYKIRIINGQNPAPESEIVRVSHSTSSTAKKTWGSIKAMFR